MNIKRIQITAISILLAFGFTGCSFVGILQESTFQTEGITLPTSAYPTGQTTVSTAPSTGSTESNAPTTEAAVIQPEPSDGDFVKVGKYIPDMVTDLRYATENNFTKQTIYDFTDAWLRYGTVKKLMLVQEELKQRGYRLKIWDGFRPPSAQFKLWDVCPNPTYVANPNHGFSAHSRGNTVDVTLVYEDGTEPVMPTGFDDFSKLADRDYSDCSKEAADNALLLEQLMIKHGFVPYFGEWWHFTDTQTYPVDQEFEPVAAAVYYAACNEYISLRTKPSTGAEVITKILAGEEFVVVAEAGEFAAVEYRGLFGYVLQSYMKPVI